MLHSHNWDLNHFFDDIIAIRPIKSNFSDCDVAQSVHLTHQQYHVVPLTCFLWKRYQSQPWHLKPSVYKWALCGLQPNWGASRPRLLRWWTCESRNVVQDKQAPQFVWLLCIVRIILSESKAENEGGSCCQSWETWRCAAWYMERGCFWRS